MALIAEYGVADTSIRDIAEAAGVSAPLVQHHYGSKEGLRKECDAYAMEFVQASTKKGMDEGGISQGDFIAEMHDSGPLIMRYVARSLSDGTSLGDALFNDLFALTEQHLRAHGDLDESAAGTDTATLAATLTAMKLGVTILKGHIERVLGVDMTRPADRLRIDRAVLAIISPEITGRDIVEAVHRGLNEYEKRDSREVE